MDSLLAESLFSEMGNLASLVITKITMKDPCMTFRCAVINGMFNLEMIEDLDLKVDMIIMPQVMMLDSRIKSIVDVDNLLYYTWISKEVYYKRDFDKDYNMFLEDIKLMIKDPIIKTENVFDIYMFLSGSVIDNNKVLSNFIVTIPLRTNMEIIYPFFHNMNYNQVCNCMENMSSTQAQGAAGGLDSFCSPVFLL